MHQCSHMNTAHGAAAGLGRGAGQWSRAQAICAGCAPTRRTTHSPGARAGINDAFSAYISAIQARRGGSSCPARCARPAVQPPSAVWVAQPCTNAAARGALHGGGGWVSCTHIIMPSSPALTPGWRRAPLSVGRHGTGEPAGHIPYHWVLGMNEDPMSESGPCQNSHTVPTVCCAASQPLQPPQHSGCPGIERGG